MFKLKMKIKEVDLNERSGYNRIKNYLDNNKDKKWNEYLELVSYFPKFGKQGIVGIFKTHDNDYVVFKFSQNINYIITNESNVMNSLLNLSSFCPHFCRKYTDITISIDTEKTKSKNLLDVQSKYSLEKECILMEYIDCNNFCSFIKKNDEQFIYSIFKQTLLALQISQKECFTHYDLHSNNILIKKCDPNLVLLYVIDEENQFCVPTLGNIPIIIDYGFSYSKECKNLFASMNFTESGFTSDRFDRFGDLKLFFPTVSSEINSYKKTKYSRKLKKISKNIFSVLKIDNSGWDTITKKCANDKIIKKLKKISKLSPLFSEYDYFCFDVINALVSLPLKKYKTNIDLSYITFINEFLKIEMSISSPYYCMCILKHIIDIVLQIKNDYINKETREKALNYFKFSLSERIDSIASYVSLDNIHFEKMLCSLIELSKGISNILYKYMEKYTKKKEKYYNRMNLDSIVHIYSIVEMKIPSQYVYSNNTKILVIDNIQNKSYKYKLDEEEIEKINEFSSITKGCELYQMIKKNL